MNEMFVPVGFLAELKERTNAIKLLKLVSDEWSEEEEELLEEETQEVTQVDERKDIEEIAKCMKTTARKEKKVIKNFHSRTFCDHSTY